MKILFIGDIVGRAGRDIDALFAGPFHPDSGHGSKNKKLLAKQLKDRREKRKDLESNRDDVIDDYTGIPDPVGGYYETETELIALAYDELETHNELNKQYSDENTPLQDITITDGSVFQMRMTFDDKGETVFQWGDKYDDHPLRPDTFEKVKSERGILLVYPSYVKIIEDNVKDYMEVNGKYIAQDNE